MKQFTIRAAVKEEYKAIGELIVSVYSKLEGFPKVNEYPDYYHKLSNIESLAKQPEVSIIVATSDFEKIVGCVVYFGDTYHYGSGVVDTSFPDTSGIRLLAVHPDTRKMGIAKALTEECLMKAQNRNHKAVILHTTNAMKIAWSMYERIGFKRYPIIDFELNGLAIYGFIISIENKAANQINDSI